MTTKITKIELNELAGVVNARGKAVELATKADSILKEAKVAELEYRVAVQDLYLSKGLPSNCRVDVGTGDVTYPEDEAAAQAPTAEEPAKKVAKKVAKKATKTTKKD